MNDTKTPISEVRMSLQITMLLWFYFAIGFGFFIGGMCATFPLNGKDSKRDIAGAFFGSILAWPALIIILLWE